MVPKAANRAGKSETAFPEAQEKTRPVTASASSPETRITAIPPFPGGVEIAAMVRIETPFVYR
jgi:hypothetical protein